MTLLVWDLGRELYKHTEAGFSLFLETSDRTGTQHFIHQNPITARICSRQRR